MAHKNIDPRELNAVAEKETRDAKIRSLQRFHETQDFKWLMSDKRGRRFMWRLLEKAGVYRSTFRLNNEMAFLEGMRNFGLMLIADINEICPERYEPMVKEHNDDSKRIARDADN